MKRTGCKLEDICRVITPQRSVDIVVKKAATGEVLYEGPAHYLTGGESFCKKSVKSLAIVHTESCASYIIEVSR